ncbi:predicted protein [Streptomyces albidoflavus]|nr:predicted protein [Streptomyces albidoflavus]
MKYGARHDRLLVIAGESVNCHVAVPTAEGDHHDVEDDLPSLVPHVGAFRFARLRGFASLPHAEPGPGSAGAASDRAATAATNP